MAEGIPAKAREMGEGSGASLFQIILAKVWFHRWLFFLLTALFWATLSYRHLNREAHFETRALIRLGTLPQDLVQNRFDLARPVLIEKPESLKARLLAHSGRAYFGSDLSVSIVSEDVIQLSTRDSTATASEKSLAFAIKLILDEQDSVYSPRLERVLTWSRYNGKLVERLEAMLLRLDTPPPKRGDDAVGALMLMMERNRVVEKLEDARAIANWSVAAVETLGFRRPAVLETRTSEIGLSLGAKTVNLLVGFLLSLALSAILVSAYDFVCSNLRALTEQVGRRTPG